MRAGIEAGKSKTRMRTMHRPGKPILTAAFGAPFLAALFCSSPAFAAPKQRAPSWHGRKFGCTHLPSSGKVLEDHVGWGERANVVAVRNGARGNAIVKIREAGTGKLLVSFFVANNDSARYELVPDGTYRIQFAFGAALDKSCKTFTRFSALGEFPGDDTLKGDPLDPQANWRILNYTLYPVPNGNVVPHNIDPPTFEAP